ncbi:MAG: radical SAM protein [Pseudolabrys sp.]
MIKPSHYDDDGYSIQWIRSAIPSNTLACLNALAEDARRRDVLGPGVEFRLHAYDETNRRVRPDRIIRTIRKSGGRALIALVGVQSNQFPRAVDLARPFLAAGLPVCAGGFHVSGCIAMLQELPDDLKAAQAMGISFFAGECEDGRLDEVLQDVWNGTLRPIYNHMDKLPALTGEPTPFLPRIHVKRTTGAASSMDLGRGCPYNVQGRKSRCRAPEDVERIIRENHEQNINCFIITDDNFARNTNWEVLFDRLVHLRKTEFPDLVFTIQVDTLSHKIPNFIEKAAQAGVRHVFIGLENINPDNLIAAKKRQNKITEYREMIQKWREAGAITYAGYILGFPADTKESIFRDIEIIKRELPLDILEFFFLTPLPGSEDHKVLLQKGIWMDPDMNKYDLNHRVSHHSKMSDEEWEDVYRTAWATYYTPEHARTIFRRAAACKASRPEMTLWTVAFFFRTIEVEGVQPLEGGAFRLKFRRDRRSGMKLENPLVFYPRYVWESVSKVWSYVRMYRRLKAILDEALTAPDRWTYKDVAITPPEQDEFERLSLYHETTGGEAALARKWRDDVIRAGGHVYDVSPRASEVTVATPAE